MQSNIFAQVAPLLREKKCDIDIDSIIGFLGRYRSGEKIYPSAIHRELKISIVVAYEVLELISDNGLIDPWLEIYCPFCHRFTGYAYKTISELPEEVNCPHCDNEVSNPGRHAVVIYRVL